MFNGLSGEFGSFAGSTIRRVEAQAADEAQKQVDLLWGVKVPMRDGVKLDATVYRPHGQIEPLPVIFTLTPYIADTYLDRALYFARNGYVFALVDVRGRGNSGGTFEEMVNEGRDGYDIVEWLAKQSWCNGKVAMWGGSYAGFNQWATLKELPPHLNTIVPSAAACPGVDAPFYHNVFASYAIQWLTFVSGVTGNANLFRDADFWISKFIDLYTQHLPFKDLERIAGNEKTPFQKELGHPTPDAYWNGMVQTSEDYQQIKIPILTITGHYDGDQAGAMAYYRGHMKHGTAEAVGQHYLIVGPWDHAGTRSPVKEVAGLTFGDASVIDLNRLHKEWYDWTMKDGPKPEFLKNRVTYYVPGAEVWKYAEGIASISSETRTLYLSSGGHANDVFQSGRLTDSEPGREMPDRYVYDPLDIRPAALYQKEIKNYLTDQRGALNLFGDGLVYHSEPFDADTEVTGYLKFVAWISIDVPDTDFGVEVDEIRPDGTSIQLTSDIMRARYRNSLSEEQLVKPGEINPYEFNSFMFFSRRIAKWSRLRLILTCPNSIYLEKNYNGGGVVAEESGKDARTAHVVLYHDKEHPSFLQLPIVK